MTSQTELTDRKTDELTLMCRSLSEKSLQPMVAVEGSSHIVRFINQAFCTLVGKDAVEMLGRAFDEAVPEGANNACMSLLERVYRSGNPEILAEQEHGSSHFKSWSYSVWPVVGKDELQLGLMVQVTDVSEIACFRQRSKEITQALVVSTTRLHELASNEIKQNAKLQAATFAKNQFLASMSHEIRTPLNAVMGFSELLVLPNQSSEERLRCSERIKYNSQLLLTLINDVLDLSKLESGKLDFEKIEVNLTELLSDVNVLMRHLADIKDLTFIFDVSSPLPDTTLSDPTRLKQILCNIIGNAIKFTADGMVSVAVSVEPERDRLRILVSDTGTGITPDQAATLFQPFTQGDGKSTRKFGGAGLGLDLARQLAQALGGDVVFVANNGTKGSVFEITIALEGAKYQAPPASPHTLVADRPIRLDGIEVLLADDVPDNQLLVKMFLTRAGASVAIADDGEIAVNMAKAHTYDLVLMDIQMPNVDGYEATARIREQGFKGPIVALTAHMMREEIDRCHDAGCDAHLSKPIGRQALVSMVRRLTVKDDMAPH